MKKLRIVAIFFLLLVVVFFSQVRLGVLTGLFLRTCWTGAPSTPRRGALALVTPRPARAA